MSARIPKKYLDEDRTVVSPEWLAWREEALADGIDHVPPGYSPEMYFPEQFDKDLGTGAWILVLEEPLTELAARFRVPLLSMWRARPNRLPSGGITIGRTKGSQLTVRPYQAVIATPGGELHLWPHEYQIVTDPYVLMSCEGATIHSLGGNAVVDEEQLFYLQSRGIPYDDAIMLMIDQVTAVDHIYVTFPEEVTELLRGVGQPLWRHIQLNPRGA